MKKSQIEMMGFAIIIILVIIGIFLLISFRIMSGDGDEISPTDESFIISFVTVFPEIDSANCGMMSDVIEQCALDRGSAYCPDPCGELERATGTIMESTLIKWQIPFQFVIKTSRESLINISYYCNETTERYAAQSQFLPLDDRGVTIDTMEITLARCILP